MTCKWLLTMVSFCALTGVVGPFTNGRTSWLINGAYPNYLLTGMILQVVGGWFPNPSERFARQNGFIFPKFRGQNQTYLSNHHLDLRFAVVTWSSHCCEGDQDGFLVEISNPKQTGKSHLNL